MTNPHPDPMTHKENTMKKVFKGDLTAEAGKVYEYTEIAGKLIVPAGVEITLPVCTSVGGYVDASENAKLSLPVCTSVGGYVDARENAKLSLPNGIKKNDSGAAARCRAMLLASFTAAGYSFADDILARIVSQRGPISRVVICGQTEVSYVVTDGDGNYAHGDTLDEARADLMVKRTSKDLTQFRAWTLDKVVSKADAILAYRAITGACAKGTAHWLKQRQTPDSLTVYTIIELTRGAYGSEVFEKFFEGKA